ncbi:MAG: DsrE/DsrF/DrsH-like family protein [Chloroflexi bacterium]|nr:DsrE/DsrF/DrsH-like family protein [Chloroflexota bacterium]
MTTTAPRPDLASLLDPELFRRLHEETHKATEIRRVALVASKGTLDMAYPPLILATTAAAMGMECGIFFTFYGLDIINKKKLAGLKVSPIANPAAPIPVPNILGMIPGATYLATFIMKRMMGAQRMPTVPQLLDMCQQLNVKLIGCTTTMGVMGVAKEDLRDGVDLGGAATFLDYAAKAQVTLFV